MIRLVVDDEHTAGPVIVQTNIGEALTLARCLRGAATSAIN